jgi:hypothetical protein
MMQPWPSIVERYRQHLITLEGDEPLRPAVQGTGRLASHINETPLAQVLFGWTSMFDLCIQQTDVPPYSVAYLRVSPLSSGNIEFRYLDTAIATRQWHREVAAEDSVSRLTRFLDQLRWMGGEAVR